MRVEETMDLQLVKLAARLEAVDRKRSFWK